MATFRLPATQHSALPSHKNYYGPREFWSLFERRYGRYVRVSMYSFTSEKAAFKVFQKRLFEKPLSLSIRPIEIEPPKTNSHKNSKHKGVGSCKPKIVIQFGDKRFNEGFSLKPAAELLKSK